MYELTEREDYVTLDNTEYFCISQIDDSGGPEYSVVRGIEVYTQKGDKIINKSILGSLIEQIEYNHKIEIPYWTTKKHSELI